MRILHTIPGTNWGGLEYRVVETALWQLQQGHKVRLATAADGEPARRAGKLGLAVSYLPFEDGLRPGLVRQLRKLVNGYRAEVLDAHCNKDSAAAYFCRDLCAIVRTRHTTGSHVHGSFWRRIRWQVSYDHIIATSALACRELVDRRMTTPDKISVVGEWADEAFFSAESNRRRAEALRVRLGIGSGIPVAGFVSILRRGKGLEELIGAAALLRDRGVGILILIVGGPEKGTPEGSEFVKELRTKIAENGLSEQVRLTGYVDDVAAVMHLLDLFVLASKREGQSRVIPEAFASGRPVLASSVGAIPELVQPNVTGWLLPRVDETALAEGIEHALRAPGEAAAVARNALAFAQERLRMAPLMERTLEAYRSAIRHYRMRRRLAQDPGPGLRTGV